MDAKKKYFIGVDVGTSSVRACIVNEEGKLHSSQIKPINIWNPHPDFFQQSSADIWESVIDSVKKCILEANLHPEDVKGIGFDATCSMVILDEEMQPLSVSSKGEQNQNVIMWMDHRAKKEVDFINSTGHSVLNSVGGVMSLEMQPPKLMWLKQNCPETWSKAKHFFDLPDFLTWRATESLSRSVCSVHCKWSYQAVTGWDPSFFRLIGLEDLEQNTFSKLGCHVQAAGSPCGSGLSKRAAQELSLLPGTPVGTSLIDAHAGALGCLGCSPTALKQLPSIENCLVVIAGTSTCHIICSEQPVSVPGVWGPFLSAVIPGLWVNEGGQSSAGSLLDFVTSGHPAYAEVKKKSTERGIHVFDYLNELLSKMAGNQSVPLTFLSKNFHMWPDFHGNRSPMADPNLCGMISGLRLSATVDDLALLYLATVQALAYGTKHIVSEMERCGHTISVVYMCGGLSKNNLYAQTHADVLGLPLILPDMEESVLLGAAMLGACASDTCGNPRDVMSAMGGEGTCLMPDTSTEGYHQKKLTIFLEMVKDQLKYRKMMAD